MLSTELEGVTWGVYEKSEVAKIIAVGMEGSERREIIQIVQFDFMYPHFLISSFQGPRRVSLICIL